MASSAEVIILSSSPREIQQMPTKTACDAEKLFGISPPGTTPSSLPSPAELFNLPSRSRFFPTTASDNAKKKKKKGEKNSKAASLDVSDKNAPTKSRQNAKKTVKEPAAGVMGDLEPVSLGSRATAAKKPARTQKSRPKSSAKSNDHGNMTLAGKVTKSNNEQPTKQASKSGQKTSTKLRSSTEKPEETGSRSLKPSEVDEELHLDEAVRRRMDWTPPREPTRRDTHEGAADDNTGSNDDTKPDGAFSKLISDYNYSACGSRTGSTATMALGGGPTKRRRIELVDAQVYPLSSKRSGANEEPPAQEEDSSSSGAQTRKKKPKSQKRFTTLTARMTAQYTTSHAEREEEDDLLVTDIGKARSRQGKSKTDNGKGFMVVSPEAAAKTLDDQDLVFGTCSQLEREDSPETLRAMQEAIRESEGVILKETNSNTKVGGSQSAATRSESSRSVSRTGAKSLWSVATRDTEGSLVQAKHLDTVDLTGTTPSAKAKNEAAVKTSARLLDDDWFDLDYGRPAPATRRSEDVSDKRSKSAKESRASPGPSITAPVQIKRKEVAEHRQETSQQPLMPHYEGFTDAELSTQIAAYGFKSVRGRKKMIELLRKCWESKYGNSDDTAQLEPPPQLSSQLNPGSTTSSQVLSRPAARQTSKSKSKEKAKAKPRTSQPAPPRPVTQKELGSPSTPNKSSQKVSKNARSPSSSFIDIDEIQDSEEEVFLSPSQVQRRYTEIYANAPSSKRETSLEFLPRPPPQSPTKRRPPPSKAAAASKSQLTLNAKTKTAESSKRNSLPDISTQITKAVHSQSTNLPLSSTRHRSCPTWHEKILMYDPIVLEDFTAWLNVEGLGLVGDDREVGPAIVREWCESKGICCCWKKNSSW